MTPMDRKVEALKTFSDGKIMMEHKDFAKILHFKNVQKLVIVH